jgi:hypothetical protein
MLCVNFQDHLHGPESVLADMIPLFLLLDLTSHAAYSQLTLHVISYIQDFPIPMNQTSSTLNLS